MMCHFLMSYLGVCPLDMYVSFPGMMQDDKGNIKVNLGIASVQQLTGPYTDTALYNIPIGFKIFPIAICSREMTHLQGSHIIVGIFIKTITQSDL